MKRLPHESSGNATDTSKNTGKKFSLSSTDRRALAPAAPQKFSKKPGGGVGVVWILTFGYMHLHVSDCLTCEHIRARCKILPTCNERIDVESQYHYQ